MITIPSNLNCPYCYQKFSETPEDESGECPQCGVRHHIICWKDNHGCTTFECKHAPSKEGAQNTELFNRQRYFSEQEKVASEFRQRLLDKINSNSDIEIANFWRKYQSAQKTEWLDRPIVDRVQLAEYRFSALLTLRQALATADETAILRSYLTNEALLSECQDLGVEERERVLNLKENKLREFQHALASALLEDNDNKLAELESKYRFLIDHTKFLSPADKERLELATKRITIIDQLKSASRSGDTKSFLDIYEENKKIINSSREFVSFGMFKDFIAARQHEYWLRFEAAKQSDDPYRIVETGTKLLEIGESHSDADIMLLAEARNRMTILAEFQKALAENNFFRVVSIWKTKRQLLDKYLPESYQKQAQELLVDFENFSELLIALEQRNLPAIGKNYKKLKNKSRLTPAEMDQCEKVDAEFEIYEKLSEGISADQARDVAQLSAKMSPEWLEFFPPATRHFISRVKASMDAETDLKILWKNNEYLAYMQRYKDACLSGLALNEGFREQFYVAQHYQIVNLVDNELDI